MHAHPQSGRGPRGLHTAREGGAVGQQGSAGHNAVVERFEDAAVYAVRPAQVIRIDDQILHGLSRFLVFPCPFGQLLFCATARVRTIDRFRPQL